MKMSRYRWKGKELNICTRDELLEALEFICEHEEWAKPQEIKPPEPPYLKIGDLVNLPFYPLTRWQRFKAWLGIAPERMMVRVTDEVTSS